MKILTGVDLVDISQFSDSVRQGGEKFLRKIFSNAELKNPDVAHLAGLFAAKEAVIKALNLSAGQWQKIEITNQKSGRPKAKLPNKKIENYDLSISHTQDFAVALFVAVV